MRDWLIFLGIIIITIISVIGAAKSHSWYPFECCSDNDCAPVDHAKLEIDHWILTSKHGTVIVPSTMQLRDSKDNKMHVCMVKDSDGNMKPLCVFIPSLN